MFSPAHFARIFKMAFVSIVTATFWLCMKDGQTTRNFSFLPCATMTTKIDCELVCWELIKPHKTRHAIYRSVQRSSTPASLSKRSRFNLNFPNGTRRHHLIPLDTDRQTDRQAGSLDLQLLSRQLAQRRRRYTKPNQRSLVRVGRRQP